MLRRLAAAFVVVAAMPAAVVAQNPVMTVTAASADVYMSPSTGSPVIGHAPRGAQLPVTRELGSWVRVSWPSAPDGVGFVHVSMGQDRQRQAARRSARRGRRRGESDPREDCRADAAGNQRHRRRSGAASGGRVPSTPVPHIVGVGGGHARGIAGRVRRHRARVAMEPPGDAVRPVAPVAGRGGPTSRATSLQFEPSALVSLNDYITNYVWLRPYAGGGISFRHQTFSTSLTGTGSSMSDDSMGYQVFGGTEVTIANAPQLAVGADVVYRSRRTAYDDAFEVGGMGIGLSAHWYFR